MLKRIIAGVLSAAICVSASMSADIVDLTKVSAGNYVDSQTEQTRQTDYEVQSTNKLGDYISDVMEQQDASHEHDDACCHGEEAAPKENFSICNMEYDASTGKILLESTQTADCRAIISFLNDETSELVTKTEISVKQGKEIVSQGNADRAKLPAYYLVRAELVDAQGKILSAPFHLDTYGKDMQDILDTDIHDFDEDQVVQFSESEDTNFVVLHEDTVIAETTEEANELVSADYDKDVYVFEHADETLQSLEAGEYFYIQPTEKDVIALNVASVEVDGDQTIVTGNGGEIEDMFDFIKFESDKDTSDMKVDDTAEAEEAGIVYDEAESLKSGSLIYDLQEFADKLSGPSANRASFNASTSQSINFKKAFENSSKTMSLTPSLSVSVKQTFNFYKKWSYVNLKYTLETPVSLSLTAKVTTGELPLMDSEKLEQKIGTIEIPTSVPGVSVKLTPKLYLEISGSFSVSYTVTPMHGFVYDSDTGVSKINKEGDDNQNFSVKAQGKIVVGLKFSAAISCFHIADCGLSIMVGIEATGELANTYKLTGGATSFSSNVLCCMDTSSDTVHACDTCLTGTISLVASASVDLKILFFKTSVTIVERKWKIADWYLSIDNEVSGLALVGGMLPAAWLGAAQGMKFGFGTCPNIAYKTTFNVTAKDQDGKTSPVNGADIKIDTVHGTTNSGGKAVLYCVNDRYNYGVYIKDALVQSGSFTIGNATKSINIELKSTENPEGGKDYSGGSGNASDGPLITTAATTTRVTTKTTTNTFVAPQLKIVEAGALGDHVSYMLHGDDTMLVTGYGDMYNFTSSPFQKPANVKEVIFENEDPDNGKVITGIGDCVFKSCSNLAAIELPHTITRIGDYAFYNCGKLHTIRYESKNIDPTYALNMPNALTSIGSYAFANCVAFQTISIPASTQAIGNYAFSGCIALSEVTVPGAVQSLGIYAFNGCTALKTAVIADGVGSIGARAFNNCIALQSLTLPYAGFSLADVNKAGSVACISKNLFNYDVDAGTYSASSYGVPKTLTSLTITGGIRIPSTAFYGMSSLTRISIPSSITSIGDSAFAGCSGFTDLTTLKNLTAIGNYAFQNCSKLTNSYISPKVTSIGNNAFENCKAFTTVTVPGAVQSLGIYAFNGCTALKTAVIADGVGSIGARAFNNCIALQSLTLPYAGFSLADVNKAGSVACISKNLFNYDVDAGTYSASSYGVPKTLTSLTITGGTRIPSTAFYGMSSLTRISIPSSITSIGDSAFAGCSGFTDLTTLKNLTAIGNYAFQNCSKLTNSYISPKVTSIGNSAFENCKAFTTVTVPGAVQSLGIYAFNGCTALKTAVIADGVGSIGARAFNNCIALQSLTLPYAGFSLADVNKTDSVVCISKNLFNYDVDAGTYSAGSYGVPNTLTSLTITGGTRIPSTAFYGMSSLTQITLPNTITSIGASAFAGCSGCNSVNMPTALVSIEASAFSNCLSLPNVSIPTTVTAIGESAFANCKAFTAITVPGNVKTLGNLAFSGCSALKTAVISNGVGSIGQRIFSGCIALQSLTLPYAGYSLASVNATGSSVCLSKTLFNYDVDAGTYSAGSYGVPKTLTTLKITGGTRIPSTAFYGMYSLTSIKLSNNILSIGDSAFSGCSGFSSLILPKKLISIEGSAFANCKKWTECYIPATVTTIGSSAFAGCAGFTAITVPNSVKTLGDSAFSGCSSLKTAVIADGVGSIGQRVFSGCISLQSLTLPYAGYSLASVNATDSSVCLSKTLFNYNVDNGTYSAGGYGVPKSLTSLTITGGTRIPSGAFSGMSSLISVKLSKSITSIGNSAFAGCTGLKYVYYTGTPLYWSKMSIASDNNYLKNAKIQPEAAYILSQPKTEYAPLEKVVTFTVKASGIALKYQWQYSQDGGRTWKNSTNQTATYKITATKERHGYCYRCIVTDGYGTSAISDVASLNIKAKFAIVTQPKNAEAYLNSSVKLSVTAVGETLSYQWQYSQDGGKTWKNSSTRTAAYTTTATTARNGYCYRCIVTDRYGESAISSVAKLTVYTKLTLLKQPTNVPAYKDTTAKFTVSAVGKNVKYQWQYSTDGGKTWKNSTNKTAIYSTTATTARNGYGYRCIVTDDTGAKLTTSVVKLTVYSKLTLLKQPTNVPAYKDTTAKFTVSAVGKNVKYQWQYSTDGGKTWKNSTNKTAIYSTTATTARNGYCYRCIVTDDTGAKLTTSVVKLTVYSKLTLLKQPTNVPAYKDTTAKFTVSAVGKNVKYQWQYSTDGGKTWKDSTNKTATYSTTATTARNGYCYRCIITDDTGAKLTTSVVKLTVYTKLTITKQPSISAPVAKDASVKIAVSAVGSKVAYQWQYSQDGGKTWKNSTNKTATYSTTATTARNGYCYRCIVTDDTGAKITSSVAKLTVA